MVSNNAPQNKNVSSFDSDYYGIEVKSFLTQHPALSLIGDIFHEVCDQLYLVQKKLTKLRDFSGDSLENSNSRIMPTKEFDVERKRWLSDLNHLELELFSIITRLFLIRKEVLNARHHVEMAELERSVEKGLIKSVKRDSRNKR
jgi:hypothetical protein